MGEIVNIEKENLKWKITVSSGSVHTVDAVAICSGHHWDPYYQGPTADNFEGTVIHSSNYRYASFFEGKRVLIIGGGVSAREISKDLVKSCTCIISSNQHENLQEVVTYCDVYQKNTVKNIVLSYFVDPSVKEIGSTEVTFNGDLVAAFDAIIYCTGYRMTIDFIDEKYVQRIQNHPQTISLFKRCISPIDPTLCFCGFLTTYGSIHPLAEIQAQYFSQIISGKVPCPSKEEMRQEVEEFQQKLCKSKSLQYRPLNVDYFTYLKYISACLQKRRKRKKRVNKKALKLAELFKR